MLTASGLVFISKDSLIVPSPRSERRLPETLRRDSTAFWFQNNQKFLFCDTIPISFRGIVIIETCALEEPSINSERR